MENPWSEYGNNDLDAELNKYNNLFSQNFNDNYPNPVNIPSPPRYDPNEFENDYSSTLTELITDKDLTSLDKIKTILTLYSQFVPQDVSDALSSLMEPLESEVIQSQPRLLPQIQPQLNHINIKKSLIKSQINTINIYPTKSQIEKQNTKTEIKQSNKSIQTELNNNNNNNNNNNQNKNENKYYPNHTDNEYVELQKTLRITREALENQDKTIKHFYKVLNINKETEEKKLEIMKKMNSKYVNKSVNKKQKEREKEVDVDEEDDESDDNDEKRENNNNNKPPLYPDYDYNNYLDEDNEGYVDDSEYVDETE